MEWLNGPLVWAIDEPHAPLYLFPRDCPRILVWADPATTEPDRRRWFDGTDARMLAHVEAAWWDRVRSALVHRYELPAAPFTSLDDAGMHVSRESVEPLGIETVADLPAALAAEGVEVRVLPSLAPLRDAWSTTAHVSGIRLRNAAGWTPAAEA